ncbi:MULTISPECIES: hypothetical protein [unclassified Sphingomonas]|uniref:hypothetical protein n=1 Tax=unclassified Sphingomonas TaxID=196159 RepID=UPI000ADA6AAF|nr:MULTISPECIES: hypothetical protein [unclassified Sphingomonas]
MRSSRSSPLTEATPPSRFSHQQASDFRRSADLAGRSVEISPDIPLTFDQPLARHHKLIGRWVASREKATRRYSRCEARRRIEHVFISAAGEALRPIDLAELRVVVLNGESEGAPAIVIICESIGQLDLGWIETSEAPIAWRAAAYVALEQTLGAALPIFGYQDLFDEISNYYWDGETDDDAARQCLINYHGADPGDLDEVALPSTMEAKKPAWMIAANAAPLAKLPLDLRKALRELRSAHDALRRLPGDCNAWHFDGQILYEYVPGLEECSTLPPLTLVPVEFFAAEVDDVGRHGMEYGFMDVAGICPLSEAAHVERWFASLRTGAHFLLAAQQLIQLDPDKL